MRKKITKRKNNKIAVSQIQIKKVQNKNNNRRIIKK